jgi:predicted phosphoribosyltransferase
MKNSFLDRREAGRTLAASLGEYAKRPDVTVLALPRGGLPIAYEIARTLSVPLDVFLVRKVYQPGRGDVLIGTLASGGFETIDTDAIAAHGIDWHDAERELARARRELADQERVYRGNMPAPNINGRTIILVYDGMATGESMVAAIAAVRAMGAARVIVAVPVATPAARAIAERAADACVCLMTPEPFYRIGVWYDDYVPVSDASVLFLLDSAARGLRAAAAA